MHSLRPKLPFRYKFLTWFERFVGDASFVSVDHHESFSDFAEISFAKEFERKHFVLLNAAVESTFEPLQLVEGEFEELTTVFAEALLQLLRRFARLSAVVNDS